MSAIPEDALKAEYIHKQICLKEMLEAVYFELCPTEGGLGLGRTIKETENKKIQLFVIINSFAILVLCNYFRINFTVLLKFWFTLFAILLQIFSNSFNLVS